jgi:hypothetical protein
MKVEFCVDKGLVRLIMTNSPRNRKHSRTSTTDFCTSLHLIQVNNEFLYRHEIIAAEALCFNDWSSCPYGYFTAYLNSWGHYRQSTVSWDCLLGRLLRQTGIPWADTGTCFHMTSIIQLLLVDNSLHRLQWLIDMQHATRIVINYSTIAHRI